MNYRIYSLSEQSVTVSFGHTIDLEVNTRVLAFTRLIREKPFFGLLEVVPAYASFSVFFDLLRVKKHCSDNQLAADYVKLWLTKRLNEHKTGALESTPGKLREIPVKYTGEDLADVARHTGLAVSEIVKLHTEVRYRVYMLGFLPGFAYLGGMNSRLATPRKPQPRLRVPAGAVAIGGRQTGIYPFESPGGWNIIGYTPVKLFDAKSAGASFLMPGDTVIFRAV